MMKNYSLYFVFVVGFKALGPKRKKKNWKKTRVKGEDILKNTYSISTGIFLNLFVCETRLFEPPFYSFVLIFSPYR